MVVYFVNNMDIETIFENLNKVELPSNLWGVHLDVTAKCGGILRMNSSNLSMLIDKAVLISEDKNLGIISLSSIINGVKIELEDTNYVVCDLDDIQELVWKLENAVECQNCKKYVIETICDDSKSICKFCSIKDTSDDDIEDIECISQNGTKISVIKAQVFCSDCKNFFPDKNLFATHLVNKECIIQKKEEHSFKCDVCSKTYNKKYNLMVHKSTHHGGARHKCDRCNSTFSCQNSLKTHIEVVHLNQKCHECDICGKTFARKDYLTLHLKTKHSEMRPFTCPICEKCFKQRGKLKLHVRIHTGEKPYSCSICDKSFAVNTNKIKHEQSHYKNGF